MCSDHVSPDHVPPERLPQENASVGHTMPEGSSLDRLTRAMLFESEARTWSSIRIPIPEPHGDEILVRVIACTICGSDMHSAAGRRSVPSPIVLGHEIVGEVVAFGPSNQRLTIDGESLSEGDRVVWSLVANCGNCFYCERNLPQKCLHSFKYGHIRYDSPRHLSGGFAGHCLLAPGTKCVKVPYELPLELACPIGCATATAVAAIEAAQLNTGRSALVLGCGLVGLMTAAVLRFHGVESIVCLEPNPSRRQLAQQFGASLTLASPEPHELAEVTQGRGFDAVIECSGQNSVFQTAMDQVRIGGRIVLVGAVFPDSPVPIVLERIVRRNLAIVGVHNYAPDHLVQAKQFALAAAQSLDPSAIVGQWFKLDDLPSAFQEAAKGTALRIGVQP